MPPAGCAPAGGRAHSRALSFRKPGGAPEERIAGVLQAHQEMSLAASLLIDLANEHGGPDDVTCVLARLGGG